jgi:Zn ribbon nucleic-acid-binding protein
MYKIWNVSYHIGIKLQSRMFCPNFTYLDHTLNTWNKIDTNQYECCDCGCKATLSDNMEIIEEEYNGEQII